MDHAWSIADREYERHEERRGRRHAFAALTAERTALVVVDMVTFFVDGNSYATSGGTGRLADRLWPEFRVHSDDLLLEKSATSPFFPGSSFLDRLLRDRGIDTVLVAGTVANLCCEATARDARALGYRVVMVADAVAAPSDDIVNATLRTIYRSFGDVRPTTEVLGLLTGAAGELQP